MSRYLPEGSEYNTKEGMKRSNAIHKVIEVLIKQNKTFMDGSLLDKDTNTYWDYSIHKRKERSDK